MVAWTRLAYLFALSRLTLVVTTIRYTFRYLFRPMSLLLGTATALLMALFGGIPVYGAEGPQRIAAAPLAIAPQIDLTAQLTDTQVYTSELDHWSLHYPQEWRVNDADPDMVRFRAPVGNTQCGVQRLAGDFATSEEFADSALEDSQQTLAKLGLTQVEIAREEVTLPSGEAAIDVVVEIGKGGIARRLYVQEGGNSYVVDCGTRPIQWPEVEPIFDAILRSFSLIEGDATESTPTGSITSTAPVTPTESITPTSTATSTASITSTATSTLPVAIDGDEAAVSPSIALEVYTNTVFHWSLGYPAEWSVEEVEPADVYFFPADVGPECRVTVSPLGEFDTLQEWVDNYFVFMAESWENEGVAFEIIRQEEITLPSGDVGIEVVAEVETVVRAYTLNVVADDAIYSLYCIAPDPSWPELEPTYEQIIRSFTLLLPASQARAEAILEEIAAIRATAPLFRDNFEGGIDRWQSMVPAGTAAPRLELTDGQAQLCADDSTGGLGMWTRPDITLYEFYAEMEIVNFTGPLDIQAGLGYMTPPPNRGLVRVVLVQNSGDVFYSILHFVGNAPDGPTLLAEDYLPAPLTEDQAQSLLMGVLVRDGELFLLVDDEVIASVDADEAVQSAMFLNANTWSQGCYHGFDNLRVWILQE